MAADEHTDYTGVAVGVSEYNEAAIKELKESKEVIDKLEKQVKELEAENAALKRGEIH